MRKNLLIFGICITLFTLTSISNPGSLFPRIKGWETTIDKTVYDKLNLWEYINGAADLYLAYDFENLYMAEYTNKKGLSLRVEIYGHSSPENAFGIYTAERMTNYKFIDVGVQGYIEPDALNFFTGEYYVKIMSTGPPGIEEADLLEVAWEIDSELDKDKSFPDVINLFPAEGKISNSEKYIARDFLGYSFFHSAFTVDYNAQEEFKLFIIKLENEAIADAMIESYRNIINEDKITVTDDIYIINDLFNGTVILSPKYNYIIGTINTENKDLAVSYLNQAKAKLLSLFDLQ